MSRVARRVRAHTGLGRKLLRYLLRFLWKIVRALFILMAAFAPGLPPPPPPPPQATEQLDTAGQMLDEQ